MRKLCTIVFIKKKDILYKKQFGFQQKHSTEHAILILIDQVNNSFERNKFILGIFFDLSKAFDIVDHKILISKLENYGVRGNNLKWCESYLNNRKQFIAYNSKYTSFETITCGVPTRFNSWTVIISYLCKRPKSSIKHIGPIMLAGDTNFFYSHHQIKTLFQTVSCELKNISKWFRVNKLS